MHADPPGPPPVRLIGLDFGSTTSSAMIAEAQLTGSSATGRRTFGPPRVVCRPEPVFTPFVGEDIDEEAVAGLITGWFAEAGVEDGAFFAGGALITGLAARRCNAVAIARLLAARLGEAVVATADDPRLESWLAFEGSAAALSRFHADTPIINLDVGGGTTNHALGLAGEVLALGHCQVGARHLRFAPGSYRLVGASVEGAGLLRSLGIACRTGETLAAHDRDAVVGRYVEELESLVPAGAGVTLSGGVGELVYRLVAGRELPGTTCYGDLGIDLARGIAASPVLGRDLRRLVPENGGRATVYGLMVHGTEVSGTTLFLPRPEMLPLRDLPIVARLPLTAVESEVSRALELAAAAPRGAAIQLLGAEGRGFGLAEVRRLGAAFADGLRAAAWPPERPLVLLLEPNSGKALGQYASDWGRLAATLIVIDEVPQRGARFCNIGRPRDQVVPVSYFGLN